MLKFEKKSVAKRLNSGAPNVLKLLNLLSAAGGEKKKQHSLCFYYRIFKLHDCDGKRQSQPTKSTAQRKREWMAPPVGLTQDITCSRSSMTMGIWCTYYETSYRKCLCTFHQKFLMYLGKPMTDCYTVMGSALEIQKSRTRNILT